ncbi:response regulator [Pseudohalocynthiibacter aestuariivivens]|jgi:DNA-binding response OmpR family regulator|uniref:Response regulator n=1 Tax=Pseudohalocynthiibacter aestuariivivens TaxID=1591409 RepID=A0ABV5JJR7_9RHOB|nr:MULTISPECIES: response regulator [Pseudohalocynthiibacter]MBS9717579.1 response regulator [Pseudohalocynthiibacter aestuariivivens]MCK0102777.1 response regulator [Pseudohalocynthiibacter sp. F2068]
MTEQKTTVLVCDDERDVREMLQEYLQRRGFRVVTSGNAEELRDVLEKEKIDLILLDVNMPGEDGLTALRNLRSSNPVAVVMLTAAGEVVDRILGLEMGADDYLGKPVDLRELEARIKAVLRRKSEPVVKTADSINTPKTAQFGKFTLDLEAAKLLDDDGSELPLTAMEFNLLKVFAENKRRVLNRDQILEQAHDRSWDPFDRSIDIRISRLRRKIEANPQKPLIIRTVRGIGYIYDPD